MVLNFKTLKGKLFIFYIVTVLIFGIKFLISGKSIENMFEIPLTSDESINLKCEKIENEVYIAISEGNKAKALKLVGELNHPSGFPSDHEIKNSGKLGLSNDRYTYNEYWNKRKEELRLEINKMGENKSPPNTKTSQSDSNSKSEIVSTHPDAELRQETNNLESKIILNNKYLGLYIFQSENGSTQFYKFIQNTSDNTTKVLYQDNINGNINIENFSINSFNEANLSLTVESKKNKAKIIKLLFKRDVASDNGYKLIDNDGIVYSFVSN